MRHAIEEAPLKTQYQRYLFRLFLDHLKCAV